ncbi:unnamed protein product [Mycena citricolor]|uniref:C2H2-type domain-containing protein n=1 Tax=Mycena citricolor TaxID=2018698 RepID=A0AAD2H072_9AGAR|nr:unnamed protein product [Mycena citricolor]
MYALVLISILFVISAMSPCTGCGHNFGSASALSSHMKACTSFDKSISSTQNTLLALKATRAGKARNSVGRRKKTTDLSSRKERSTPFPSDPPAPCSPQPDPDIEMRLGSPPGSPPAIPGPKDHDHDMDPAPPPPNPPSPSPPPVPPFPNPPPSTRLSGRPARTVRRPARFRDEIPDQLPPAPQIGTAGEEHEEEEPELAIRRVTLLVRDRFTTAVNKFGLYREYLHRPTYDPDALVDLEQLANKPKLLETPPVPGSTDRTHNVPPVYESEKLLFGWNDNGNVQKSDGELEALVHDVIQQPGFDPAEFKRNWRTSDARARLDKSFEKDNPLLRDFEARTVKIEVPSGSRDVPPKFIPVPGLLMRKITTIITEAFTGPLGEHFHFSPFKLFCTFKDPVNPVRIFSELYNSNVFIAEHDNVRLRGKLPPDAPKCKLEKIVAALMFWSDSTHLANFGPAKMWPLYIHFGNLSKYIRAHPSSGSAHYAAFIPENAFLESLGDDFELHRMLVVDLMHEFELGVWKNVFIHLLRLLEAQPGGQSLIGTLDSRYRQMPRFGRDTIRRFFTNPSEMKKLGARDFEDLLQCAIPAFSGLFPGKHDRRVCRLLFRMAEWQAFAKLRMHTDRTINHLETLTPQLGALLREFTKTTCAEFETYELAKETAARNKRHENAVTRAREADPDAPPPVRRAGTGAGRVKKTLNLNTYKTHAMGDYVTTILDFGPTDGYSTQIGESLHRLIKRFYSVTNKRGFEAQIGRRVIRLQRARAHGALWKKTHQHVIGISQRDSLGDEQLNLHHQTSKSNKYPLDTHTYFRTNRSDPAFLEFIPKLQDHLLARFVEREFDADDHDDFSDADRNTVRLLGNRILRSKTIRINYTTYDVRRDTETLNPRLQPFVMVMSAVEQPDPYWYAQVIGVFSAVVFRELQAGQYKDLNREEKMQADADRIPRRMEFLWVRWLGPVPGTPIGFRRAALPKVGYVPETDKYAFGFLDPARVLRGAHLIPDFDGGQTNSLLETTDPTAARISDDTSDWEAFFVNIFADRDMILRYFGGGVGHQKIDTHGLDDDEEWSDEDDDSDNERPIIPPPLYDSEEERDEDEDDGGEDDEEEEEDELDLPPEEEEDAIVPSLGFAEP